MYRMSALIGGVVAGAAGAAIWAVIAYFANMEIGWIAWGIGLAVGVGVAVGNRGEGSVPAGVLAALLAAASVVVGKYATVQLMLPNEAEIVSSSVAALDDPELLLSYVADDVVREFAADGRPVRWPAGGDSLQPTKAADYPADVWAQAQVRWGGMTPDARAGYRADLEASIAASVAEFRDAVAQAGFLSAFGLLDIVFFGLAILTAFKIARAGSLGSGENEAEPAAVETPPGSERGN